MPRIAPARGSKSYRIAQIQFDIAAEYLKLDAGLRQILRTPKRVLEVSIPTKMDNGQVKVFTGYRVQHNVARGPAKGGIRYHPERDAGRSEGAGDVDDVEDGHREHSLWRRQGRSDLRSEADEQARTRTHDAALHFRNFAAHRARAGYSRAGRLHRRADHGVDHGHVLHDQGIFVARSRHGQAGFDRRLRRAQRSDGARMPGGRRRSVQGEENVPARRERGDSGIRQRGIAGWRASSRRKRRAWWRSAIRAAASSIRAESIR